MLGYFFCRSGCGACRFGTWFAVCCCLWDVACRGAWLIVWACWGLGASCLARAGGCSARTVDGAGRRTHRNTQRRICTTLPLPKRGLYIRCMMDPPRAGSSNLLSRNRLLKPPRCGFDRSIHDGASVRTHNTHNRSLHDISPHNRSAHDLSMRTPSRHSHEASLRRSGSLHDAIVLREINHSPSLREHSVRDPSVRELSTRDEHSIRDPSLHEHSIRDPSIREASIRDPSIREQSLRGGGSIRDLPPSIRDGYHSPSIRDEFHSPSLRDGFHSPSLLSPSMSNREILSDGDRENDHTHNYERESPLHSRVGSPSLHAPSRVASPPLYYRDGVAPSHRGVSPSLHAPSHRGVSPSLHAPSHRGASPSLHAPSYRGDSPSLHEPSRGVSPSLHAPSRHGSPPVHGESPNASLYAPSERSRHAGSVTSSKYPMVSSILF